MKTLITGGTGFIGSALTQALANRGDTVTVLDIAEPKALPPGVSYVAGSILDVAQLSRALEGHEAVIHIAGDPRLWRPDPEGFEALNARGTVNVLAAAQSVGVKRVVHTSSVTVYVGQPTTPEERETDAQAKALRLDDMLGPYSRSKWMADQAAFQAAADGLETVLVAPTLPVGPGDVNLTPPTAMMLDFLNGRTPAYLETNLNLVDVRDLAAGMVAARDKGQSGKRYLIGGHDVTLSELLHHLQEISGRKMPRATVPGWLAETVARADTALANTFRKKPPKAPLDGVQFARKAPCLSNQAAVQDLGLTCRPLVDSLTDAIADFRARGLVP